MNTIHPSQPFYLPVASDWLEQLSLLFLYLSTTLQPHDSTSTVTPLQHVFIPLKFKVVNIRNNLPLDSTLDDSIQLLSSQPVTITHWWILVSATEPQQTFLNCVSPPPVSFPTHTQISSMVLQFVWKLVLVRGFRRDHFAVFGLFQHCPGPVVSSHCPEENTILKRGEQFVQKLLLYIQSFIPLSETIQFK